MDEYDDIVSASAGESWLSALNRSMATVAIALLRELPATQVVFSPLDGSKPRTVAEMRMEIHRRTDLADQWVVDLLRVSRDLLARKASK